MYIWGKYKKNTFAKYSLYFIIIISVIALLGYLITPDKTPYANQQFLEIAALPPASKCMFVKIPADSMKKKASWVKIMIFGQKGYDKMIPISSYEIKDTVLYLKISGFEEQKNIIRLTASELGFKPNISSKIFKEEIEKKYLIKKTLWLGTDRLGRDVLSRLIIGARVSLSVGFISVFISLIIGVFLGGLAGYFRGRIDSLIMWMINVTWSIPTLLLVLSLTLVIKKGLLQVFIAIGLTMWVDVARIVRGQMLSLREKEFIEATRAMGFSHWRILVKHILPFTVPSLLIVSTSNFASAILIESGLSFLGLGVQPPVPSWGSMIKEHYGYLLLNKAYLPLIPGIAMASITLAFIFIANGIRDAMDIKMSSKDSMFL